MDSPVFILSTGRTGTKFFEDYINNTSVNAICRHEPRPSRRFKFLSNLYLNHKVRPTIVTRTYLFSRRRLFRTMREKIYVESSNFIFGCIPPFNTLYEDIKIIHIVRHPVDYVKSHLNHGFWRGHKKFFAQHVPYWLENLTVSDPSNPIELLSARWNFVNRQIQTYSDSNPYMLVRFEDLFSENLQRSSSKVNEIRVFCGLPELEEEENIRWLQKPKNYSRHKQALEQVEVDLILKNTNTLMKEYLYTD